MSDIYYVDIQDLIRRCEDVFISFIDKYYIVPKGANASIIEAEKTTAKAEIGNLCRAIEHRIELLLYIKDIITDFNWEKYHRFYSNKEEAKEASGEEMVSQILQKGKIVVNFKHKESMENFVFINLMSFFSILTGIIDNLALVLKLSFNLKIPKEKIITIVRVQGEMPEGELKDKLHKHVIADKDFAGVLNIRKYCEHMDHSQIFPWSDTSRSEAVGSRVSSEPIVRKDLVNIKEPGKRQIGNYCEFAYNKLYNFLKSYLSSVIACA